MRWKMILKEFCPDRQHISGEKNIMADAISRLPTANGDQNEQSTQAQGLTKIVTQEEHLALEDEEEFPLNLFLVWRTQERELKQKNSKLKKLVKESKSGFNITDLD